MITGIVEVTQDPEKAGSALKVLSLRLRGMKGQLEELGEETDENVENISKMQGQILNMTKGKVNIFDGAGNFKSTYEIMKGIAEVWDELSSIDQANLLETIAGKNRANDVAALLSNWKNVEAAVKSASEAEGSAARENAKYVDSLQGRLDKLTTAWQSFANTFMESDFLKGGVSALTGFVEILEKLVDILGTAGTIGLGAGIFGLFKSKGTGLKTGIFSALSNFGSTVANVVSSSDTLITKFKGVNKAAGTAGAGIIKSFGGSLSSAVAGIGLLAAGLGLAYNLIKNYKEAISEARQKTIQASDEFLDASSSFEQAYIKYSGKTDLTSEEEAELSSAIKGTVDALGDKSSALQSVVNGSNDYLTSLERIKDAELEAAKKAAIDKRDKAELELKDAAKGWTWLDGSEVRVELGVGLDDAEKEAISIANELESEFFGKKNIGKAQGYTSFFDLPANANVDDILDYYYTLLEYQERLSDADLIDTSAYDTVSTAIDKMAESIKVYTDGVYDAAKAQYQLANGIPKTVDEYLEMREGILKSEDIKGLSVDTKKTIAGTLDSEYGQIFDLSSAEVQSRQFIGILDNFTEDHAKDFELFLNMRTAVNNGDCTVGDYMSQLSNIEGVVGEFSEADQKELNLAFGLNTDSIKKQYEDTYNYISRNYLEKLDATGMSGFDAHEYRNHEREKIQELLNSLSATELQAVANIKAEIDWETADTDKILAQIKEEAKFVEAMNFTIAIDVETESIEALNSAMAESVSGAGLSSDSIIALKGRYDELAEQGYDLSSMFEETANGIHLNRSAVSEFEQALASGKLSETQKNLDVLKGRYDELTKEIDNCSNASERASLYREQQTIAQKINDLGTLASQYEGLASSYNAWLSVEEAGQERDMYEQIIEGFENIGDEISRGWLDDGTIKFLELMTGQTDLASKSASELKQTWKDLDKNIENTSYSVKDFFTTDEDGNSTSAGVYNFLKALQELESSDTVSSVLGKQFKEIEGIKDLVTVEDGKITAFNFDVVGGDEAIAEALGISEELVQIMLRAADDAGFVVTLDGNWTQFADLKNQAEKANDALKKIAQTNDKLKEAGFGEYEFNFGADTVEEVNAELDKAKELLNNPAFKKDGKFNIDADGAEEALKIAETLQITKSKLEEPAYMSIDTSELQKQLQEPVKLLQKYETLTQEKDLLNLTGTDKKRLNEIDTELNNIATKLSKLPDETKIDLGIDGMTPNQIREELENGTIEVPAELTIEANMDKNLEDLVTLGLLEQGLIDEKTAKIRLGLEVEVDEDEVKKSLNEKIADATSSPLISNAVVNMSKIIGKYDSEEQEVVIKYLADTSEYDKFEAEDKKAVVKFIADSIDVDGYKPEDKEAYARYIADGGNLDNYTPEQKEAIVKYFTEDSNIENYQGEDKEAIVKFLAETSDADGYTPQDRQAIAKFIKDSLDVDNYQMPTNKWAYAKYLKDTYDIDIWTPEEKDGVASYTPYLATTSLPSITGLTAWYTPKIQGGSPAAGTASPKGSSFATGTSGRAFARGDWGIKGNGVALGGELGQELVVRDGKFFTIGDDGAEFFRYRKNDIVFNASQTASLFKYGGIKGANPRGKMLANGTAFAQGNAFSKGTGGGIEATVNSVTGGSYGKSSSSSSSSDNSKEEFEETIDWIEIAIDRIERAIDQLDTKANSAYRSWSERNTNLVNEISKVSDEIDLQQRAYNKYIAAANAVGLSSSYAEKVRNGTIDIETVKDETLKEKIDDYQKWYEKALDCQDAILELKETESELYAQRFENVQTQYDGILQGYEHTEAMLNEYISQAEEKGYIVSKKYYQALIDNEKSNIAELKKEQADLIAARDEAVESGAITKYSEEWYNMCAEIDATTQAIEESTTALLEFDNAMREIDWSIFDLIQERISGVTEEADFLVELMSNKKLFDDDGKLTSQGLATMGLHAQNYNSYMYQSDELGAEVAKLNKQIAKDPYDQELINRRNELLELQRESILAAEDEKNAIRDMVEEGISLELDALQELIDKKNEALESEKD